jgi:hypothetical protein
MRESSFTHGNVDTNKVHEVPAAGDGAHGRMEGAHLVSGPLRDGMASASISHLLTSWIYSWKSTRLIASTPRRASMASKVKVGVAAWGGEGGMG